MFERPLSVILTSTALLATQATAETLTFDTPFSGPTYTEAGMTIETLAGDDVVISGGHWSLPCCSSTTDKYELTTGGMFDFLSIDILHSDPDDPITFTGYSGTTKIAETVIDLYDAGYWEFTGFTGIDRLIIAVSGTFTDPVFDDLTYNSATPVPLPAGGVLLMSGMLVLGHMRRRKQTS